MSYCPQCGKQTTLSVHSDGDLASGRDDPASGRDDPASGRDTLALGRSQTQLGERRRVTCPNGHAYWVAL